MCLGAALVAPAPVGSAVAGSVFDNAEKALNAAPPTKADSSASSAVPPSDRMSAEVAALKAATAQLESAWQAMPLTIQNAFFVTRKADGYGIYEKRPTSDFAPGETINVYVEPIGYVWKPVPPGSYTFGLSADLAIKDSEGNVLFEKPGFATLPLTSHEKNREFMVNFDIHVTGLKPGPYQAVVTLHDLNGPKTATFALRFRERLP